MAVFLVRAFSVLAAFFVQAVSGDCEEMCGSNLDLLCGSDGVTYINQCLMDLENCKRAENNQEPITVLSFGRCPAVSNTAEAVVASTAVQCPAVQCSNEFFPVCGSDGNTYPNECMMQLENCGRDGVNQVQVDFEGTCASRSKRDDEGSEASRCQQQCANDLRPVCATDGIGYLNQCLMEVENCRRKEGQKPIKKKHDGWCPTVSYRKCSYKRPKKCHVYCKNTYEPVCGSDGVTYMNKCMFERCNCKRVSKRRKPRKMHSTGECKA